MSSEKRKSAEQFLKEAFPCYIHLLFALGQAAVFLRLAAELTASVLLSGKIIAADTAKPAEAAFAAAGKAVPLLGMILMTICICLGLGSRRLERKSSEKKISGNRRAGFLLMTLPWLPVSWLLYKMEQNPEVMPDIILPPFFLLLCVFLVTTVTLRYLTERLGDLCELSGAPWQERMIWGSSLCLGLTYVAAMGFRDSMSALFYYRAMNLQILLPLFLAAEIAGSVTQVPFLFSKRKGHEL